jgi:predicted ribosome quality control (RQC) complex YloA/Tae2 family protein
MAVRFCEAAGADADRPADALESDALIHIGRVFEEEMQAVKAGEFSPAICEEKGVPTEFSVLPLKETDDTFSRKDFDSVSELLFEYYSKKNAAANIKNRSTELRKTVATHRERVFRKLELQEKQLEDAKKAEIYKVYGDLLSAYGYGVEKNAKTVRLNNFYDGNDIDIPLDPSLSAIDNAKRYYDRFARQRRAEKMLDRLIPESKAELDYLDSVKHALEVANDMADLTQIRDELTESGYLKKKAGAKKQKAQGRTNAAPMHFMSSDGFDIYVGKNNIQNEELTFKLSDGNDWWFHAKGVPGSHVVLKTNGREVPDRAFEEAAALAARFSSANSSEKVSVDYTLRKNVKKPSGARPGFVVYYTNYSMIAEVSKADGLV